MSPFRIILIIVYFFISFYYQAQTIKQKDIVLIENEWSYFILPSKTPLPFVKVSLSFNNIALLMNAEIKDAHFKDGDRSWRYGDGFYINFVTPIEDEKESSDKFYGFGFSLQNGNPISVLVNKDGKYFPGFPAPPPPEIKIDSTNMIAYYSIEIPWKNLYPFHPFKNSLAGINIVYISQNDDRSRIIQQLINDNYDTESTNQRKFVPLKFLLPQKYDFGIVGEIKERVTTSRKSDLDLWMSAPKKIKLKLTIEASSEGIPTITKSFIKQLIPGLNHFKQSFTLPKNNGRYNISVRSADSLQWSDNIYKYNDSSFDQSLKVINLLTDSTANQELRLSGNTLAYHINKLKSLIGEFGKRDDVSNIKNSFETLGSLLDQFTKEHTVFNESGYILGAFKSKIDSTLQPFSIVLPENFDNNVPHNLMIVLHGSGVDEINNITSAAKNFGGNDFIIVAPRGRDLSAWYVGNTETDVIELITQIKTVFNIDKTILYGFSMGGYGVWRFGLLYPSMFDTGIIISGSPFNPRDEKPKYDMNNFVEQKIKLPYLVVHGTVDNSLDISYTDSFVEKLKGYGFNIEYHRVEGGGHGNFPSAKFVLDWLTKMNFIK